MSLQKLRDGYAERAQQERKGNEQTIEVNDVETQRTPLDLIKQGYSKDKTGEQR
ncbi:MULTISPECIES: hypothetical protein [Brevibacillus]|uniref:hypothetical protein n=1 Tax=Brevibacillus TaxID=55080 RepID=UPI00363DBA0A